MGRKLLIIVIIIFFSISFMLADDIDIDLEGYGTTGITFFNTDYLNHVNNLTYYRGKLQTEIEYGDDIKAQLDFRGDSEDHSITFKEYSIRFEFMDYFWVKAGNIKKPFGYEQLKNRDDLVAIDRSYAHEEFGNIGYGGRAVSLMAYYEYEADEDTGPPISYFISGFKENSQSSGFAARFMYHANEDIAYGINYMFISKSSMSFTSNAIALDMTIDKKRYITSLEAMIAQDPVEGVIRQLQERDDQVMAFGSKWLTAYKFKFDKKFMVAFEPLIQMSFFMPEMKKPENNVVQMVLGFNYYLYDDVRFRFNGDLRLTKNEYISEYDIYNSRATLELFVKF